MIGAKVGILTPKEVEVADLVAKGMGNREISILLGNSEKTIKCHLTRIFEKAGVTNRTQLALLRLGAKSSPGDAPTL